jgi:predicted PurR-regulated permease PerM
MTDKKIIDISSNTIIRIILFGLLLWIAYLIRDIIAIVLFSVVIASAVDPAARWFLNHKIPRTVGVLITYLIAFVVLGTAFYIVIPSLFSEFSDFLGSAPSFFESKITSGYFFHFLPKFPASLSIVLKELFLKAQNSLMLSLGGMTSGFFQATVSVFGGTMSFLLIIVISFYLSVQERGIENFLRIIAPKEYEKYIIDLWARSRKKIGKWFQGQLLLGLLVGILVFLGLTILRVKYALLLAILSAIFELIPIFGPIMAAIPAIAVAFLQSPSLALAVLVLYVIIQQFENHLIYPVVVRSSTGVPPILVILALIIGGKLGGFFGILLAVPLAAVLVEIMNDIASKKEIA